MKTKHTRGALRAVNALNAANGNDYEMLISSETAASIIDRETASPELTLAVRALMSYGNGDEFAMDCARAALAKADAK